MALLSMVTFFIPKLFPSVSVLCFLHLNLLNGNMFLSLAVMLLNSMNHVIFNLSSQEILAPQKRKDVWIESLHSGLCSLKAVHTRFSHFKVLIRKNSPTKQVTWPSCGCSVLFWEFLAQNTCDCCFPQDTQTAGLPPPLDSV